MSRWNCFWQYSHLLCDVSHRVRYLWHISGSRIGECEESQYFNQLFLDSVIRRLSNLHNIFISNCKCAKEMNSSRFVIDLLSPYFSIIGMRELKNLVGLRKISPWNGIRWRFDRNWKIYKCPTLSKVCPSFMHSNNWKSSVNPYTISYYFPKWFLKFLIAMCARLYCEVSPLSITKNMLKIKF